MAKGSAKGPNSAGTKRIINKHLHARVAYLDKIAKYVALQQPLSVDNKTQPVNDTDTTATARISAGQATLDRLQVDQGLPYWFATHLRAVSLKSQVSLAQDVKHSYCKVCNAPLICNRTSEMHLENRSKGGKKPWANVQVIACLKCHAEKRFPVGARRQDQKTRRSKPQPSVTQLAQVVSKD